MEKRFIPKEELIPLLKSGLQQELDAVVEVKAKIEKIEWTNDGLTVWVKANH